MQQIKPSFLFSFGLPSSLFSTFSSALVPVHIETPGKSLFDYVTGLVMGPSPHQYLILAELKYNLVYAQLASHSNMVEQTAGRPRVAVGYTSLEATPTPCADFE